MKKFLFMVGAIMCVTLLSVCLSSCDEEKEPLAAIYTINSSRDNEVTKFADDPEAVAEAKANYQALVAELQKTLPSENWTVSINNKNQDEVLKREDENAKKKFDEAIAKINAFKTKLDNLDKTQAKNQFDWDFVVNVTCTCTSLNFDKTIATQAITFHYDGLN